VVGYYKHGAPNGAWLGSAINDACKVRPCLVLTPPPKEDELAVTTVIAHTTSLRGNRWEVKIPKSFLGAGTFDVQRIATVATVKFERKLGEFTPEEFNLVLDKLAERLGL